MNIVIDIGNTRTKIGLFKQDGSLEKLEVQSFRAGFTKYVKTYPKGIVSSVRHTPEQLMAIFPEYLHMVKGLPTPITNAYKSPETLGYDRLAAACGASFTFPNKNCLILDLGTAAKYDFIDKNGVFQGGIIAPGLQMRFKALHYFTKKLPLLKEEHDPQLIGATTVECIQSGVVNGMSAEINGIIAYYGQNHNLDKIILTGGDASFFESKINYPTFAAQNLVLTGLNRILEYNAP